MSEPKPTYDELLARLAELEQAASETPAIDGLLQSALQLRAIIEQSPISMAIVAMDGTIEYINRRAVKTFGYLHEDIPVMERWWALAYPDESYRAEVLAKWMGLVERAIASGEEIERAEYSVTCKDGVVKTMVIFGVIVAGKVFVMFEEITERKRAEEALRQSEMLLRSALGAAPIVLFTLDAEGIIRLTEGAGLKTLGLQPGRVVGLSYFDVYKDLELGKANVRRALKGETVNFTIDALGRTWDVHHSPLYGPNGEIRGMVGTSFDITDRQRAEQERANLQAQLQQAQKIDSVGRLAGGVAHDFNNMLGVILGHTELAMRQVDPTVPLHDDLEEIRKAAMRSADLTRQLLAFARKQTVTPKVLDLNETVAAILKMLHRLIGEDIALHWQPGAKLWSVKVDSSQIDQILANLCVNARDAISGVGKLTIETGNITCDEDFCAAHTGLVPGEYVRLSVSDDGAGMDRDTQSHLFEPFFTSKATGKGTGLGLATVYGIVKQNNGSIGVHSEPGRGTTFHIYLPRHHGTAEPVRNSSAAEPAARGHETILLVEDEPAILRLTTGMLERMGYIVLAAGTPGEAMRLAAAHSGEIQLLLTDVIMPEMNGRVLAENLLPLRPRLKRLFMSGYTANAIAHHGVLDDGVPFLQKPFSTEDLAAAVRDALDSEQAR